MSDLESIVQKNKAQEQQAPARIGKINNPITEARQEILNLKLSEELDDTQHSKNNTSLLNKRYSEVMNFFFIRWRFYALVALLLLLSLATDKEMMMFALPLTLEWATFIANLSSKIIHIFGVIFIALLSFPTAKGLRRLFKSVIEAIVRNRR